MRNGGPEKLHEKSTHPDNPDSYRDRDNPMAQSERGRNSAKKSKN